MDIGKIQGPKQITTDPKRPEGVTRQPSQEGRAVTGDVAQISASGRETFDAVEALTEKLREDAPDRREIVEAARAKLESGALDDPAVYEATARRLLEG